MKKKLLLLFTILAIGLSNAWAYQFSYTYNGQTLYYNIVNGSAQVTYERVSSPRYPNLTGALVIPASVTYNGTTYSVTSIGGSAFSGCSGLTSVTIPNSVTSIGSYAFYGCSKLTSVTIPNSVTTIGSQAFEGCRKLTSVNYMGTLAQWCNIDFGSYANPTYNNPGDTLRLFIGDILLEGSLVIPEGVEAIKNYAFHNYQRLSSVTIPNSVTSIGAGAFVGCRGLTSVTIPNSVTSIGDWAFNECSSLTSVTIPNSVTSIGSSTFRECSGLTSVTIPNSVTSIGTYAFYGCSGLTSVTIPNSVTTIGNQAFLGCSGLTSVTIGNSVTSIGSYAFVGCRGLTSVTIPNSVTSIENEAFYNCSGLTSVTIGNSVASIGSNAFKYCSNLKTVYNLSDIEIGINNFDLDAKRIVTGIEAMGSGKNALYKIPESYSIVMTETDQVDNNIPESSLPTNFIAKKNGNWFAKNIVLTDSRTENNPFTCDVDFTAASVTYNREFDDDRSSTVCLPFAITPAMRDVSGHKFKLYDFISYNDQTGMATFNVLTSENTSVANHPYLIQYENNAKGVFQMPAFSNVQFTATTSMNNPAASNGFHFEGTYTQQTMANTANKEYYGIYYGYFVKSNGEAKVNPFRGYFYTLDAPQGAPAPAGIDYQENEGNVGIELVDPEDNIRYSNDVYDLMGRCVRKNADSLRGLPQGIYIWKGKKMLNY